MKRELRIAVATALMLGFISVGVAMGEESDPKAKPGAETVVENVDAAKAAQLVENRTEEGSRDDAKQDDKQSDDQVAKVVVLDIRTPVEFESGHIKGAKNIDFRSRDFREQLAKLDRKQPYLLHCRSGARSAASLEIFKELGFTKIHHLEGGILAWQKAGKDVVSEQKE